mmetsp:Transcript_15753/g.37405  ORF Transcript_15753/g.37405 Transcript_15753/m.37405 type:complete len:200 (-) Transcript_15753:86-685(-)
MAGPRYQLTFALSGALLVATALCKSARRWPLTMGGARALPAEVRFGRFLIPQSQIFYESASQLTVALVNMRPIVPGHVLVVPRRVVARMADLTDAELCDLWRSTREIGAKVEAHYGAEASNVAVQDGLAAGQTVPHVHVHILPRARGDFERSDDVYDALEKFDGRQQPSKLHVPKDEDRTNRTAVQMAAEAEHLRRLWD